MLTLLMPGMDGTGRLFAPFQRALPPDLQTRVVSYPVDQPLGYEELLARIARPKEPFAVVAESFSGPLAIRLASEPGSRVRALVLAATFARNPVGALRPLLRVLFGQRMFALGPPRWLLRRTLLGADATEGQLEELQAILASVEPAVLARRLREILAVDVTESLSRCRAPMLYVAGRSDRLVGRHVVRDLIEIRPDLRVRWLDAPHLVLQRRPVEAAAEIADFLLGLRDRS